MCHVPAQCAVVMTGKQQVDANLGKRLKRKARPPGQVELTFAAWKSDRMMGYQRFEYSARHVAKSATDIRDLLQRNSAIFSRQSASSIYTQNCKFVIAKEICWVTGGGDVMIVFCEGIQEAGENIVKRHIMVPGDDQFGLRDAVQEVSRLGKFNRSRALCKIAAEYHQIGVML
jgi:hypothetical protein